MASRKDWGLSQHLPTGGESSSRQNRKKSHARRFVADGKKRRTSYEVSKLENENFKLK